MFWENFLELCKQNGTSPNGVCAKLGLSTATSTHWKNGSIPKGDALLKIADYFSVSVDFLLGRTKEKEISNGLSDYELRLLNIYRSLSTQGQEYIQQTADMAALKYKKAILSSDIEKTVN